MSAREVAGRLTWIGVGVFVLAAALVLWRPASVTSWLVAATLSLMGLGFMSTGRHARR